MFASVLVFFLLRSISPFCIVHHISNGTNDEHHVSGGELVARRPRYNSRSMVGSRRLVDWNGRSGTGSRAWRTTRRRGVRTPPAGAAREAPPPRWKTWPAVDLESRLEAAKSRERGSSGIAPRGGGRSRWLAASEDVAGGRCGTSPWSGPKSGARVVRKLAREWVREAPMLTSFGLISATVVRNFPGVSCARFLLEADRGLAAAPCLSTSGW